MFESARLSGTDRFSADKILTLLKGAMPRGCDRMLGLSSRDIFSPKTVKGQKIPYWGIFGLGYQPGNACVVSDFRLKKFNGKTEDLTVNVVLHECGHNFGLPHCSADSACLMNDAKGTIQTLFREKKWLCPSCRKKINPLRT